MTFVQNQGNQQLQQVQPQQLSQVPAQAPQVIQPQPLVAQPYATNPQTQATSPSYAGVNIQIYNPSVGIPGLNPNGLTNNPQSLAGMAYPSNYYTQQYGLPANGNGMNPNGINGQVPANGQYAYAPGGVVAQGGNGGSANIYNTIQAPAQNTDTSATLPAKSANDVTKAVADDNSTNNKNNSSTTTNITETISKTEEKKKTEKRKVVELTDEYIKNLENYLNSQDKEVRMMGAKEVIARLQEDNSRKEDPALTALINKMLQDPDSKIRLLALSMIESRICTGNDYTVGVLKKMQNGTSAYGQDAAQATSALLKMSGKVVEKEFEVPENNSKK